MSNQELKVEEQLEEEPTGYCKLEEVEFYENQEIWATGCPLCGTNCWEKE